MQASILTGFLKENFIETGSLKAFYSFESFAPRIIFNDLYPTGVQIESGVDPCVYADYYPAISIGATSFPTSGIQSISGSGFFKGADVIKIHKNVSSGDWTIFLNLNKPQQNPLHDPEVIFSESLSGNYSSGLVFGINDANRFFVEFKNSTLEKTIYSSVNESANRQIVSLSKLDKNLYLSLHNKADREYSEELFDLNGSSESYSWFFGGFLSGTSGYIGYSGYIDDLLLFDSFLDSKTRHLISDAFFLTGHSASEFINSGSSTVNITGVSIVQTGNIGTGITGYNLQEIALENGIKICQSIALTGILTGQVVTYLTGSGLTTGTQRVFVEGVKLYDYAYLREFTKDNILFTKFVSSSDNVEIYSRNIPFDNLNLNGIPNTSITGYNLFSGYSAGNVNIYLSGKALYSGTDYEVLNSSSLQIKIPYSGTEDLMYDVVSGDQYVSGFTGYVGPLTITNTNFAARDLYLNGKNLFSGFDYSQTTTQTTIALNSQEGTGVLLFLPKMEGDTRRLHIEGSNYINVNFNLLDERVWLNGLRQRKGKDYVKTPDNSLLNSDTFINSYDNSVYDNGNDYFNT